MLLHNKPRVPIVSVRLLLRREGGGEGLHVEGRRLQPPIALGLFRFGRFVCGEGALRGFGYFVTPHTVSYNRRHFVLFVLRSDACVATWPLSCRSPRR